jgi:hypothetical protein
MDNPSWWLILFVRHEHEDIRYIASVIVGDGWIQRHRIWHIPTASYDDKVRQAITWDTFCAIVQVFVLLMQLGDPTFAFYSQKIFPNRRPNNLPTRRL